MNFGTILMSSSEVGIFILTCFICLAAGVGVAYVLIRARFAQAGKTATKIIDEAKKVAEENRKSSLLETKQELHTLKQETDKELRQMKSDCDKEIKEKRRSVAELEQKLSQREDRLDNRSANLDKREESLNQKERRDSHKDQNRKKGRNDE